MSQKFESSSKTLQTVRERVGQVVVGQENLVERLLLALLCNGHVLLEGVPGVAKTLTVNSLARAIHAQFSRIQFTPDLLPGDLTGTLVYDPRAHTFTAEKGPIFTNLLLADEINRAPAKVQSALLEAMQEKQVTLGKETYDLPKPFLVLATQNPIEQEGTYALPEAQVDRFMFKLKVGYPSMDEELIVMQRMAKTAPQLEIEPVLTIEELMEMRSTMETVFIDEKVERYILRLVDATRHPENYDLDLERYLRFGASPRASIYLSLAARGHALMQQRDYVIPQDVKDVAHDLLRHRMAISYRAEAESITSDDLLDQILAKVPVSV
ncbi:MULTISPECIES: MoxR family ATPase [unclassified Lentimonas]|uniref:AAA family ATPase n=1 Tax=unclassified Lentimonas TaxID=2630993 RepID=UPI001323A42E|nr:MULTISPECIES: MoxR family ATPase [unclassified Lentimonas]CAA6677942.1 MoxR-like ATPase in aerotolerance operon [Lentimonas sp. CC4]CAA6684046.1 MoxR-like ATPase in aerotolerance operon [Lentimonas sp. CC6]CAA7076578.1 MoxR-like ATPase in aerotolerance operon [Lentimonas sp. CC4]CAA7170093.1 MoxR-like ATPase in aerotolerance operon [Lentimonas sp. CC21]CAA7181378.1 MoxR-like ATPase in aerotolerance operon [Lentimonas sp. CC8]